MEGGGKLAGQLLAPHAVQHEVHRTCVIQAGLLLAGQVAMAARGVVHGVVGGVKIGPLLAYEG